jgi:hypothetical protein
MQQRVAWMIVRGLGARHLAFHCIVIMYAMFHPDLLGSACDQIDVTICTTTQVADSQAAMRSM